MMKFSGRCVRTISLLIAALLPERISSTAVKTSIRNSGNDIAEFKTQV
jgi:hypothetical protein